MSKKLSVGLKSVGSGSLEFLKDLRGAYVVRCDAMCVFLRARPASRRESPPAARRCRNSQPGRTALLHDLQPMPMQCFNGAV